MGAKTGAEAFWGHHRRDCHGQKSYECVIPMARAFKQEIYDTFMDTWRPDYCQKFLMAYTYSPHPIACAAGLASLGEN